MAIDPFGIRARRAERAAERAAFLTAIDAVRAVSVSSTAAVSDLAHAVQSYLTLFNVQGTEGHTHSDFSEWRDEQAASARTGLDPKGLPVSDLFPTDGSPEEQLSWVLLHTDHA